MYAYDYLFIISVNKTNSQFLFMRIIIIRSFEIKQTNLRTSCVNLFHWFSLVFVHNNEHDHDNNNTCY